MKDGLLLERIVDVCLDLIEAEMLGFHESISARTVAQKTMVLFNLPVPLALASIEAAATVVLARRYGSLPGSAEKLSRAQAFLAEFGFSRPSGETWEKPSSS